MIARSLTGLIIQILVPTLLLAAATMLLYLSPPLVELVRLKTFDTYNGVLPRPPSNDIAIVAIDEESIRRLGQWPWPRNVMGEVALRLRKMGAKAVAFDIVFSEPDRIPSAPGLPDPDEAFAQSVASAGNVVLAFGNGDSDTDRVPAWSVPIRYSHVTDPFGLLFSTRSFLAPIPALSVAAGGGSIIYSPEKDGIMRRVPLMICHESAAGGIDECFPALSIEALRVALGDPVYTLSYEKAGPSLNVLTHIRLDDGHIVPTDEQGRMWLYDSGHRPALFIPAWKLLAGKVDADRVRDKIVFVGATAGGLMDSISSPLSTRMPGVEFHAQFVEQMLHGQFLQRTLRISSAELIGTTIAGLAIIGLAPFVGAGTLASLVMLLVTGGFLGGLLCYADRGWLLDPVCPALTVLAVFMTSSLIGHVRISRRGRESLFNARHDPLTGLENRAAFNVALERAIARASRRPSSQVALLMIDLDGFKAINDTHGHTAGDSVLKNVADRLRVCARTGDIVCRLGGDEFAVILEGSFPISPEVVAQKILTGIGAPIALNKTTVAVGCSIGISIYPTGADNMASLIEQADAAMYTAKQSGKNTYRFARNEKTKQRPLSTDDRGAP